MGRNSALEIFIPVLFVSFSNQKSEISLEKNYTSLTINGKSLSGQQLEHFASCYSRSESVSGWQKKMYLFIQDWLSDDAHVEARTSGSTGPPKTIRVKKADMVKSAQRTGAFLHLKPGDRALLCLPIDFIAGKMMIVRAFVLGLNLIPANPVANPTQALDTDYEFSAMTPMQVYHILSSAEGSIKLNSIKTLIIGGGEVDQVLTQHIQKLTNKVYHTYGMTETLTHIAMKKLNGSNPGKEFQTLPGVTVELDAKGCLVIHDPLLGLNSLTTSDVAKVFSNTSFKFLGRADGVINTGGVKIIPEVVENKLKEQIPNRLVVLGEKDAALGEKVTLIIEVGTLGFPEDLEKKIGRAGLTKFEVPRSIKKINAFPESSSGKIIRKHLLDIAERE